MRYLKEKIITDNEELINQLSTGSKNSRYKTAYKIIDSLDNAKNLKNGKDVYADSIVENGIDTLSNPFLSFMLNISQNLNRDVVSVIKDLVDSKVLNINSRWLYKPSLYTLEPNDEDIIFKIKALTYADNPRLQTNANKKISVESLQDKQGWPLKASQMEEILNKIQLDSTENSNQNLTIFNAINKLYKNFDLPKDEIKLKKFLAKLIQDDVSQDKLKQLMNKDLKWILNIPVQALSEKQIKNSLINYLISNKDVKQSNDSNTLTGAQVLLQKLGINKLDNYEPVKEYILKLFNPDDNGYLLVKKLMDDEDMFNQFRLTNEFKKVFAKKYTNDPLLGTTPIEEFNKNLKGAVASYLGVSTI